MTILSNFDGEKLCFKKEIFDSSFEEKKNFKREEFFFGVVVDKELSLTIFIIFNVGLYLVKRPGLLICSRL